MSSDKNLQSSFDARSAAWSQWGTLDSDVITHLLNPAFMGGPRWPAMRQAFRVARNAGAILVASDGLSDPFDDAEGDDARLNGYGLEIYASTRDALEKIPGSWLFQMVWQVSQLAADNGGLRGMLDEMKLISTEVYDVTLPAAHEERFVNEHGRVAVLLGVDAAPLPGLIQGPLSDIRLVSARLLTLKELAFVMEKGAAGRRELAERFGKLPEATGSSLTRKDVL